MKKLKVKSIDDSKQNFFFMHLIDILKLKKLFMPGNARFTTQKLWGFFAKVTYAFLAFKKQLKNFQNRHFSNQKNDGI